MSAEKLFFTEIDWTRPWYASVLPTAQLILTQDNWREGLNRAALAAGLSNHRSLPLQFIPQEELPDGVAYESHISEQGRVPTRDNLHDFFNALVWLRFPKIKRQLNAMQAAQIEQLGIGKSRGPARDAATIFDENAAILVLENSTRGAALLDNLRQHEWLQAFVEKADLFQNSAGHVPSAQVWSFGHALMEKLVNPYKAITAHTWVVWAAPEFFCWSDDQRAHWIDQHISQQLMNHNLTTSDYTPLPVLGVPGWWQTQDLAFYQDTNVFRPKRRMQ